jgi:uncharacterized protein YdaT
LELVLAGGYDGDMPWDKTSFREKHNKDLTPAQSAQGAKVANAILAKTGDEGKAIRIGNYMANKYKSPRSKA